MQILEQDTTATGEDLILGKTQAADKETIRASSDIDHDGWRVVINEPLIEWGRDPSKIADEGIDPPTREMITFASEYAMHLRDRGCPPPDRVVPNGDGGIAFEKWTGSFYQVIEFEPGGIVELLTYRDSRLVGREELSGDIS